MGDRDESSQGEGGGGLMPKIIWGELPRHIGRVSNK